MNGGMAGGFFARASSARRFFRDLGPGLITGAADDDPSGIATYSSAGASFGFGMLWVALFTIPLMSAVQLMCARIGLVSRRGLASVLRRHYSARLLWFACFLPGFCFVAPDEDCHARRRELQSLLGEDFGIRHVTLQVDHATDREKLLQIDSGSLHRR